MTAPRTTAADLVAIAAQLAGIAARLAEQTTNPDELVSVATAAAEAKCSVRTLTDARRRGELQMYGGQRTRAVRRADLDAWVESRRVRPVAGAEDADMDRRVARLARGAR